MKVDNNHRFSYIPFAADEWQAATRVNQHDLSAFTSAMQVPPKTQMPKSLLTRFETKTVPPPDVSLMDWNTARLNQRQAKELDVAMEANSMIQAAPGGEAYKPYLTASEYRELKLNVTDPDTTKAFEARVKFNQQLSETTTDFDIFNESAVVNSAAPKDMGLEQAKTQLQELDAAIIHATLAEDVYEDTAIASDVDPLNMGSTRPRLPEGYERVSDEELLSMGFDIAEVNDSQTGYFGAVYINELSRHIVVANRGTEGFTNVEDMGDNIAQIAWDGGEQIDSAAQLARFVVDYYKDDYRITFTGHSLGGNLAAFQSLLTGMDAYTYNAAGMSNITREIASELGAQDNFVIEDQLIAAYYVDGDPISTVQDSDVIDAGLSYAFNISGGKALSVARTGGKVLLSDDKLTDAFASTAINLVEDYIPSAAGDRRELKAIGLDGEPWTWSDAINDQIDMVLKTGETREDVVWLGAAAFERHSIKAVGRSLSYLRDDVAQYVSNYEK